MRNWLLAKLDSRHCQQLVSTLASPFMMRSRRPQKSNAGNIPQFCLSNLDRSPLARGHAHNDYQHQAPLYDALSHHFNSIEADIYYLDDEFYVAHYFWEIRVERTLRNLYLDPLRNLLIKNNGRIYQDGSPFFFFIDIKLGAESTYRALRRLLDEYQDLFTSFTANGVQQGPVTVIITGNRPISLMENERKRYAAIDGRFEDLDGNYSPCLMPFISDRWSRLFRWNGNGSISISELRKLRHLVKKAHQTGKMVRFWATPDASSPNRDRLWRFLLRHGVDWLNTDDLTGLHHFLNGDAPELAAGPIKAVPDFAPVGLSMPNLSAHAGGY